MSLIQKQSEIEISEKILSDYLFASDFYEVKNWSFDLKTEGRTTTGHNDCFCILFVRKGNFLLDLAPKRFEMHTGHIIVEKPDYEYRMRPAAGQCSIFNFSADFYRQTVQEYHNTASFFFSNANILSIVLNSGPETDYLHHQVMRKVATRDKLAIDNLVLRLVEQVLSGLSGKVDEAITLPASLRKNHIGMIERAKEYMNEHFSTDISLQDLAGHCHMSLFHFARVFKRITGHTPYQYLLNIRLKHARILLHSTRLPVTDICYTSGFNNADYFTTLFRQKYGMSPSQYRHQHA